MIYDYWLSLIILVDHCLKVTIVRQLIRSKQNVWYVCWRNFPMLAQDGQSLGPLVRNATPNWIGWKSTRRWNIWKSLGTMRTVIWLAVLTILKNISQWEGLSHILWKQNMFQTTNQIMDSVVQIPSNNRSLNWYNQIPTRHWRTSKVTTYSTLQQTSIDPEKNQCSLKIRVPTTYIGRIWINDTVTIHQPEISKTNRSFGDDLPNPKHSSDGAARLLQCIQISSSYPIVFY